MSVDQSTPLMKFSLREHPDFDMQAGDSKFEYSIDGCACHLWSQGCFNEILQAGVLVRGRCICSEVSIGGICEAQG